MKTHFPLFRTTLGFLACCSPVFAQTPSIAGGNGSFETTSAANTAGPWWGAYALNQITISGWSLTNPDGTAYSGGLAAWFVNNNSSYGTSADGDFFVNVEGGPDWWLTTNLENLTVGNTYTITFKSRKRDNSGTGTFDVTVNTAIPAQVSPSPLSTAWATESFTFVAESTTHTLTISNTDNPGGTGFMVDQFSIVEGDPNAFAVGSGIWIGADGNWTTASNWENESIAQGADQSATFSGFTPVTVAVDADRPIGSLLFSGANHTLAAGSGSLTLAHTTSNPSISVEDGISATIAASLKGTAGFTKSGLGTLILSAANPYAGTTTITSGTLVLQENYAANSQFSVAAGAQLELNVASGSRDLSATNISGAGTLLKTGAGSVIWGPARATFALGSGSLIDVREGRFTAGSYGNEIWTDNRSNLNVESGAEFRTVEANVRVNQITGSGTITSGYYGAGYQNLTIGVDDGSSTFSGMIANADAPANLVKEGSGTITLAGINTYTGNTTINTGTLALADDSELQFVIKESTATPPNNTISGTTSGTVTLGGDFRIDTSGVSTTKSGTWTLVNFGSLKPDSSISETFTLLDAAEGVTWAPEPDGITWTKADAKGTWTFSETTGVLTLTGSDFTTWASNNAITDGESGDADGDGLTNFQEYAFGLDPKSAASVNPILTPFEKSNGTFSYTRRKSSLTGISYTVYTSTDLVNWTAEDNTTAGQVATEISNSENESVAVTLTTPPTATKFFVRIGATQP